MKILVVEDDRVVAQSLQFLLSSYNYAVDVADDGEEALRLVDAFEYHLVLLDILLPGLSGIEVCRQLRKKGFRQPILLLTGQGETQQKAFALNTGADDYVVKPFDNNELIARIQALLRRGGTAGEPILTWGYLSLDPNTRKVAYRDQLLVLTPKEYAILELFLRHQDMVFSARSILDLAWRSVESPGEEAVRCHIKDLRQKLTAVGAPKDLIKTVYRVGYRLNPLYAASTPMQVDQSLTAPQVAELRSVNEELRIAMEKLQATQAELQQKNQELQAARDELEQRVADRTIELGQREAFLRSIYDEVIQTIFVVDVTETRDFRYVSFNPLAEQLIGRSAQALQGKTPEEAFGATLGNHFRKNYERCLQTGTSITYEEHLTFEERTLWALTTLSPLRNAEGTIYQIVGTAIDISDRKHAEAVLRESEEEYRSLFNSIDEGFCLIEMIFDETNNAVDYRFLDVNRVFGRQTGLNNVVGKLGSEAAPNTASYWLRDYGTVAQTGELLRVENYNAFTKRWYSAYASRIGGVGSCRVAIIFDDITERKRREANLEFLADISETCSRLSSAEDIIQAVGEKVGDYLNVVACNFCEIDEAHDQVIYFGRWQAAGELPLPSRICLSEQVSEEFYHRARAGETIVSHNTQTNAVTRAEANASIGALSFITVPFHKNGDWTYLFSIHDNVPRTWQDDEIELVQELANRLFPRLERARAEATIAGDLKDIQLLHDLSTRLTAETDIQVLYDEIVTTAIALMQSDMGSLQILERSRNELHLQSSRGFHPDAAAFWQRVTIDDGSVCSIALTLGEQVIVPDIETCDALAGTADLEYFRLCGIRAVQSTPLISRSGQLIGMFSTHWCKPRQLSDRELRFLDLLARQAADLIEQRQSEAALRHNQEMFAALVENAPFGIYIIDAEFRLQQINRGAEAAFSNIEPLIGRDFGEILRILWQEPFATEVFNRFRHTLATGESYYSPIIVEQRANIDEIQAYDWQIHRITFPDSHYGLVCYFYDLSEIKRTEAALRESNQLLQLTMAGAQAGVWDWVLATGQLTWSPETYKLFGLDPDTPLPTCEAWYNTCLHPDDRLWASNYVNQIITQRQPDLQLEFRILHPQLGVRWILCLGHLTVNEQGEPIRLSGIDLDISDRKQAELTLQKQIQQEYLLNEIAQEIRRSLHLNDVLSSTVHRVRKFLEVDRVVIFRFRPDWQAEVIMESVGDEWTPILSTIISDPCFRDHYIESYRQGRVATISDIDTANLEPCHAELLRQFQVKANLVVPILQNNHLWGLLIAHHCTAPRQWTPAEIALLQRLATQAGIAIQQAELYQQLERELSDRQQAEAALSESQQQLQLILDHSPAVIYLIDSQNRHLLVNRSYANLLATTPENLMGKSIYEVWTSEVADRFAAQNHTVLETNQLLQTEEVVPHPDGTPHTYLTVKFPLRDAADAPYVTCGISTDITERKQFEAQFYRAQRLESLGTLASGIAHDLNNALTPVLSIAQLLQMKQPGLEARSQEMLQALENSAQRGVNMVKQILTFTRGTEGERIPVDVASLFQEVVNVTQQTFPKFITIRATTPTPRIRLVSADVTQLHQVLMNLCVNARDAMPTGGILTLSVENFDANEIFAQMNPDAHVGQYVLITVADTGTGIAPEVRDRIFDPFFTTKAPSQGTGLGLSTALGIVRSYGGFIQVASEVGRGTQFKIYLPAIKTETEAVSGLQEASLPEGQGELILVIDDEGPILQSTRTILETHNYQVLTASNGAEAIAIYAQHQQDIALVLVDMMMPDIDGVAVIRVLQGMNPNVRAIAVSGLLPQYQNNLETLGITTHLNKPYTTEALLNSIHLQLRLRG